jgi:Leucine-rich repeat (LRR) protein
MSFKIEEYLNSLPLDIEHIDVSNRGLTYLPNLQRFTNLKTFICAHNKITWIPPLNNSLIKLVCVYNNIKELPCLNENLTILNCSFNKLTKLPNLNENLEELDCSNNKLTVLPKFNDKLSILNCSYNQLTNIPRLNENIYKINSYHNLLKELPQLNNKFICKICLKNNLSQLPNLNNMMTIIVSKIGTKDQLLRRSFLTDIISDTLYHCSIPILVLKYMHIIENFRFTYYCLRFKTQFKKWLWERVRQPNIMAKFHPDHLNTIKERDDLEVFLEEWTK